MFVSISWPGQAGAPATDLGYLLHKHPDRTHTFPVSMGTAHVWFPEATETACTAALLLEVDPIALVRNKRLGGSDAFSLSQYVNDRPYAASSMLAVALGKVFATARSGRCEARPELAQSSLELTITIPALPCRGGEQWAERFFAPLGWHVQAAPVPLDPAFPAWGASRYIELTLTGSVRLADALQQLYVLLPVLDDAKHYWVGPDEVDKLIRAGTGWLADHPEREAIAWRYLAHRRRLTRHVSDRLLEVGEDQPGPETDDDEGLALAPHADDGAGLVGLPGADVGATAAPNDGAIQHTASPADGAPADAPEDQAPDVAAAQQRNPTPAPEAPPPPGPPPTERLADARRRAILAALAAADARSVIDLGCGEGRLLADLLAEPRYERLLGVDVSVRALERAADLLHLDTMPERRRERIELRQSSLTYRDPAIAGFDAAVLQEVIEHIDPPRLAALERNVFGSARPGTVIVTTPNVEYNVRYPNLAGLRHRDHRFEWDRPQFAAWAQQVAGRTGYRVEIAGAGEVDPEVGQPTQLAVFTRQAQEGETHE